jgi:hypothetical protein
MRVDSIRLQLLSRSLTARQIPSAYQHRDSEPPQLPTGLEANPLVPTSN